MNFIFTGFSIYCALKSNFNTYRNNYEKMFKLPKSNIYQSIVEHPNFKTQVMYKIQHRFFFNRVSIILFA